MNDATSLVWHALIDSRRSDDEIVTATGLSLKAVHNGLRNLLREGKVEKQTDNGVVFWRLG